VIGVRNTTELIWRKMEKFWKRCGQLFRDALQGSIPGLNHAYLREVAASLRRCIIYWGYSYHRTSLPRLPSQSRYNNLTFVSPISTLSLCFDDNFPWIPPFLPVYYFLRQRVSQFLFLRSSSRTPVTDHELSCNILIQVHSRSTS
jgi:hypothetical protein